MTAIQTILIIGSSAALLSCGIKGPPLPPIVEETVQKQLALEAQPISADTSKPPSKPSGKQPSKPGLKEEKKKK